MLTIIIKKVLPVKQLSNQNGVVLTKWLILQADIRRVPLIWQCLFSHEIQRNKKWSPKPQLKAGYISALAASQATQLRKILSYVQHERTKHIKVKYHAIREAWKSKEVNFEYQNYKNQIVYIK